jgi:class 3 adenylate cyclase
MFADLAGFTSFSEGRSPGEVIDMVNAYWERQVPMVVEEGGFIERFAGDAILVLFQRSRRPTRPFRCGPVERRSRCATRPSRWPQLIPGGRGSGSAVNTGPVVVGNVGAGAQRSFAALGNTTNVAARLQAGGEPGSDPGRGRHPSRCLEVRSSLDRWVGCR